MQNKYWTANTLESGISIRVRLLIFENFSRGYVLIKGGYFYWFLILKKNFLRIFNFLFLWQCIKESNYLLFKRGLRLFKGLCLLFLPNVPGAMFIQGGTFIPGSRVNTSSVEDTIICCFPIYFHCRFTQFWHTSNYISFHQLKRKQLF